MSQKKCANLLRAIVIVAAIAAAAVYFALVPSIAVYLRDMYPEFAFAFWPWLIYVTISCVPVYWALFSAWQIFTRIGLDRSFCDENARDMRTIAILAAADGVYFFVGSIAVSILVTGHPAVFLLFTALTIAALILSGVCAALAMLIGKASRLQEENDLTI